MQFGCHYCVVFVDFTNFFNIALQTEKFERGGEREEVVQNLKVVLSAGAHLGNCLDKNYNIFQTTRFNHTSNKNVKQITLIFLPYNTWW